MPRAITNIVKLAPDRKRTEARVIEADKRKKKRN